MSEPGERRASPKRQLILRTAARQFAHRPYAAVNLDDILADAGLTKGAMYVHFASKQALALAIIDDRTAMVRDAANKLLARKLSGLETLIDLVRLIALLDAGEDVARAGAHLLESIGGTDGLQAKLLGEWANDMAVIVRRAVAEGDIVEHVDPEDVGRQLIALYVGIRQASGLDEPEVFLANLEKAWLLALPGFANPERIEYFTQFIRRRRAHAMGRTTPGKIPRDRRPGPRSAEARTRS